MKNIIFNTFKYVVIWILFTFVAGCEHQFSFSSTSKQFTLFPESVEYYLKNAKKTNPPKKQEYLLLAAGRLIEDHQLKLANNILQKIPNRTLTKLQQQQKHIILGKLALANNEPQLALANLSAIFNPEQLPPEWQIEFHQILALAYARNGNGINSVREYIKLQHLLPTKYREQNTKQLWKILNQYDLQTLDELLIEEPQGVMHGWLELAVIAKRNQNKQIELQQWQAKHPNHPGNLIVPDLINNTDSSLTASEKQKKIALLLPLSGALSKPGSAVKDGFMAAKDEDFDKAFVTIYDTSNNQVISAYKQAIDDGAEMIVGPLDKSSIQTLAHQVKPTVPVLALNNVNVHQKNIFEFGLSPQEEAIFVASKARSDGYNKALVLNPRGQWGQSIAQNFIKAFQQQNGQIVGQATYSSSQELDAKIKSLLQVKTEGKKKKFVSRRQDADMIFIVASPTQARQILPLLKFYFANDLPTYSTSFAYSSLNAPEADLDLDGLIFCDMPWVFGQGAKIQADYVQGYGSWPETWNSYTRLYALGFDAYQLTKEKNSLVNSSLKFSGKTGELQMDRNHKIYRELKCAKMQNGTPQTLSYF